MNFSPIVRVLLIFSSGCFDHLRRGEGDAKQPVLPDVKGLQVSFFGLRPAIVDVHLDGEPVTA
jgi:hypothetical protein